MFHVYEQDNFTAVTPSFFEIIPSADPTYIQSTFHVVTIVPA